MGQKQLIVGIDPGITTAYAVLDLDGNLIKLKSGKDLHLNSLLEEISSVGKVMIVGTDVKHNPSLIEKFAAKVGAKIIAPQDDMKIGFKERITAEHRPRDDHQRDALAAALQAFKQVQPTFEKVNNMLRDLGKEHLNNEVKELVLRGKNITQAIASLEEQTELPVVKQKKKRTGAIKYSRFGEEKRKLLRENRHLRKKMMHLQGRIDQLTKKLKQDVDEKAGDVLEWKDKKINFLQRELMQSKQSAYLLQNEIQELENALLESKGKIIARKFNTLDFNEVYNNTLGCDVLVVEDVNTFSERALDYLKDKVNIIVYKTQPTKRLFSTGFSFVNATKLSLLESGNIVVIREEELETERKKKDVLAAIVQEYRQERESLV